MVDQKISQLPDGNPILDTDDIGIRRGSSNVRANVSTKLNKALTDTQIFVGNGADIATAVAMSGEATIENDGSVTLNNDSVIAKLLTGYSAAPGVVSASDSILSALEKIDANQQVVYIDQSGGTGDTYGVLSGAINDVNTTYTVSYNKYQQGSLRVYLNGQLQIQGTSEDWVETTPASGIFDFNNPPQVGDEITVVYNSEMPGIPVIADTEIVANKVWSSQKIASHISFQEVIINSESDFPTPVSGVITLVTNTMYVISAPAIVTANRFVIPSGANVGLRNSGPSNALVYVGTGTMITGVDINAFILYEITLLAQNGTLFDITGTTSSASYIIINTVIFDVKYFGRIHDISAFFITVGFQNFSQGIECQDNPSVAVINLNVFVTPNTSDCVFFTFKGTIPFITMNSIISVLSSNETLFDLDSALTVTSGQFNTINVAGDGTVFKAGSLDQTHIPFKFTSCVNIADSTSKTQAFLDSNVLTTDIPAQNAWVIINGGTTYTFLSSERMTAITDGGSKYTGLENVSLAGDGNINFEPVTATKNLEAAFVHILSALYIVTFTNGTNIINETAHGLSNNDTISFKNTAGTLPSELRTDVLYFVVNAATDTFQVSYTLAGAAVTFTDDGTPTNSYSIANKRGGIGRATIAAGNPSDVIPQALLDLNTNCEVYMLIRNTSDAVDVDVNYAYFRLRR